jgi:hypothetical protein
MLRRLAIGIFLVIIAIYSTPKRAQAAFGCGGWTTVCVSDCPLDLVRFCKPYNDECSVNESGTVCDLSSPDCFANESAVICAWEAPK